MGDLGNIIKADLESRGISTTGFDPDKMTYRTWYGQTYNIRIGCQEELEKHRVHAYCNYKKGEIVLPENDISLKVSIPKFNVEEVMKWTHAEIFYHERMHADLKPLGDSLKNMILGSSASLLFLSTSTFGLLNNSSPEVLMQYWKCIIYSMSIAPFALTLPRLEEAFILRKQLGKFHPESNEMIRNITNIAFAFPRYEGKI